MVVFTCQHCNACLKKPVVEKHYHTACRKNSPYLTCIDCLKDFRGNEYESHTSCLTEDQRYGGKDFVQKPQGVKQTNWVDFLLDFMSRNSNNKYSGIYQRISNLSNIPRKKPKFINFCRNNGIRDLKQAEEVFDLFQDEFNKVNKKGNMTNVSAKVSNTLDDISNTEKVDKKEKKKQNNINEDSENQKSGSSADNKSVNVETSKKSKKRKVSEVEDDSFPDNMMVDDSESLDKSERKKKKIKKNEIEIIKENQSDQEGHETNNPEQNVPSIESQFSNGLSKKELKKLKKKQKYEAALKQIESEEPTQLEELPEDSKDPSKLDNTSEKKSKKSKKKEVVSDENENQNNNQKVDENLQEQNEVEHVIPDSQAKFHWDEVIMKILIKRADHTMAVKRLCKKVLAEYQAVKGDREPYEELLSKFNKKIGKIPGVKVLKDKAKLQVEE